MQITIAHPSHVVALGIAPAVERFTLTQKQLRAWNAKDVSAMPCPIACNWLRGVSESRFNPTGPVTWADVKDALE